MSYISWPTPKNTPTGSYSPPPQDNPVATTNALGEEGGGYLPSPKRPTPKPPIPSPPPMDGGTTNYYGEGGYYPPSPKPKPIPLPQPQPYPIPAPQPIGQSFSTIDVLKVVQEADGNTSRNFPADSPYSSQSALTIYRPSKDGVVTRDELKGYLDGLNKIQNIQFDPQLQQKKDIAQALLNNYSFVASRDGLPNMSFQDIVQTASRDGNVYDFNTRTDLLQLKLSPVDFPIWNTTGPQS